MKDIRKSLPCGHCGSHNLLVIQDGFWASVNIPSAFVVCLDCKAHTWINEVGYITELDRFNQDCQKTKEIINTSRTPSDLVRSL